MKKAFIFLFNLLLSNLLLAQHFINSGSIAFEKSVNTYALIKKTMGKDPNPTDLVKFEEYQKAHPQFKVLKSTLVFNDNTSLFTPIADEVNMFSLFNIPMTDQNNIVYKELNTERSVTQKTVFDKTYLVKDSTTKINWKITDETREIAGYVCRRANALVFDSIYVVAFYTDDIHVSSGPELFGGLPGMILEVALPHDNVIWRAVTINNAPALPQSVTPPTKGTLINNEKLINELKALSEKKANPDLTLKALLL